jgi:hypothetical protein
MIEHKSMNINHFYTMTDDVGLMSRAVFSIPERNSGYLVRENAAALSFVLRYYSMTQENTIQPFIALFLSFIYQAYDSATNRFKTMSFYNRDWLNDTLDIDQGYCLWALGMGSEIAPEPESLLCSTLFSRCISELEMCTDSETKAAALMGATHYLKAYKEDECMRALIQRWSSQLLAKESEQSYMVYWACLKSAHLLKNKDMLESCAATLLEKLAQDIQDGLCVSTTSTPEEVSTIVGTCVTAFNKTNDERFKQFARYAYNWFLGLNPKKTPLVNVKTGGCYAGFNEDGSLDKNEHASSSVAWLHALCDLQSLLSKESSPFLMPQIKASVTEPKA